MIVVTWNSCLFSVSDAHFILMLPKWARPMPVICWSLSMPQKQKVTTVEHRRTFLGVRYLFLLFIGTEILFNLRI